jgi:hypothetical protein
MPWRTVVVVVVVVRTRGLEAHTGVQLYDIAIH